MMACESIRHLQLLLQGSDAGLRGAAQQALTIIHDIHQHGMTPLNLESLELLLEPIFDDSAAPLRAYLLSDAVDCPLCQALQQRCANGQS